MQTSFETTWEPSDDQMNHEIYPAFEELMIICEELQGSLNCPTSYVIGLIEAVASQHRWHNKYQLRCDRQN